MIKKRSVYIFCLILLLLASISYFIGIIAKNSLYDSIEIYQTKILKDFSAKMGKFDFNVKIIDYQRGWFTSKAKIRVNISPKLKISNKNPTVNYFLNKLINYNLDMDSDIYHGPFLFFYDKGKLFWHIGQALSVTRINFNENPLSKMILSDSDILPVIYQKTVITLLGNIINYLSIPDFEITVKGALPTTFKWQNLYAKASHTYSLEDIKFEGNLGKLEISNAFGKFDLTDLKVQADNANFKGALSSGKQRINIGKINIYNKEQNVFYLYGLQVNSGGAPNAKDDKLLNLYLKVLYDDIFLLDKKHGQFHLDIDVKNLNNETMSFLENLAFTDEKSYTDKILNNLPNLFTENSKININDLNLSTSDGSLKVKGEFNFIYPMVSSIASIKNAFDLFKEIDLTVNASKALTINIFKYALLLMHRKTMIENEKKQSI